MIAPAPVLGADPALVILSRFRARIAYATDTRSAVSLVAEILADAPGRFVAVDFETAPIPSERERLQTINLQMAEVEGRLKALTKLKAAAADKLITAKAERSALLKAQEHAEGAWRDPHRSDVRLCQLYAGGDRVVVIDMARVDWSVLTPVWERRIVMHNALYDLGYLAKCNIEPIDLHCSLQAVRLLRGPHATALATAAKTYLDVDLSKAERASDWWSAEHLSLTQLQYAACDAIVTWHLAEAIFPLLGVRASAYEIQMAAIPAVVRMQNRGIRLDTEAHSDLTEALRHRRAELVAAYATACEKADRPDLGAAGVPSNANAIEELLTTLLTEQQRQGWPRTRKTGKLSTRRSDLATAADAYPLLRMLIDIGIIDKQLNTFGAGLAAQVSPVTGRIHASYSVAGTVSGRASCSRPNLQQIPDNQRISDLTSFRTLVVALHGYQLVAGDWTSMEMRAAAAISGDVALTRAFADGLDPHALTAATMLRIPVEAVTKEQRKYAKAVNFGRLFGQGTAGLMKSARDMYGIVLDRYAAEDWIRAFQQTYPEYAAWCRRFARECERTGQVPIGREGGRIHEITWNPDGYRYTQALNLPIQGQCADAAMLALAGIDQMLFEAGIDGGPVAWLHDEILLEVRRGAAPKAARLLEKAMIDAFAETFAGAPLNGLVDVRIGDSWLNAKVK